MRDFPEVREEPTSDLPAIANNPEFNRYSVDECPNCGGDAIRIEAGGAASYACRQCQMGCREFQQTSNYGADWKRVREWVLDRDGRECVECGSGESLEVHHIEKLVWHETTSEAHQPDNLKTLCESCHVD